MIHPSNNLLYDFKNWQVLVQLPVQFRSKLSLRTIWLSQGLSQGISYSLLTQGLVTVEDQLVLEMLLAIYLRVAKRQKTKWFVNHWYNQLWDNDNFSCVFNRGEDKHPSFDGELIRFHYLIPNIITLLKDNTEHKNKQIFQLSLKLLIIFLPNSWRSIIFIFVQIPESSC